MRQPVFTAAVFVLTGLIAAMPEAPPGMRAAAVFFSISFLSYQAYHLTTGRAARHDRNYKRIILAVYALLFVFSFIRGLSAAREFNSSESAEFFESMSPAVPGQFDYSLYLKSLGIRNRGEYEAYLNESEEEPDSLPEKLRAYLGGVLDTHLDQNDAGLYKAVLLGDRSDLDEEIQELYRVSGISHLLAVSGLHVSVVGAGIFGILKKLFGLKVRAAAVLSSAAVFFYMLLCGSQSSVVRASVMLILAFAAVSEGRSYYMRNAAASAFIVTALWEPYRIASSGFQMSFAAVFSIDTVGKTLIKGLEAQRLISAAKERRSKYVKKSMRLSGPAKTLIMSFAIQISMLPIIIRNYYTVPVYGMFLNLMVIPLIGIVIYSGLTLMLAGAAADLAGKLAGALPLFGGIFLKTGALFNILSSLSAAPGHYVLRFYEFICRAAGALPLSNVVTGKPSLIQTALYYGVLFICVYALNNIKSRHSPKAVTLTVFAALIINAAALRYYEKEDFYVMALNVGQGDGFVIKSGGTYITVDGGSSSDLSLGERKLEPFLLSRRITDIDMAVVSHADYDHVSGISYVLSESGNIKVKRLALSAAACESKEYDGLKDAFLAQYGDAADENDGILYLSDLSHIYSDGATDIYCVYAGNTSADDANRQSDVLLLKRDSGFSMLFTGDAESEDEERIAELYNELNDKINSGNGSGDAQGRLTVLKAAHHGSKTSSSDAFLDAVRPVYALLSYGKNNSYGHPSAEVIKRLGERNIGILSTCNDGTLIITDDGVKTAVR